MRTTIVILSGWILLLMLTACSENYTPRKYMGLKGKVTSLRDTVYRFKYSYDTLRTPDKIGHITIIGFDDWGNITSQYEYLGMDSVPFQIEEYLYSGDTLLWSSSRIRQSDGTYAALVYEFVSRNNNTVKYKIDNGSEIWEEQVRTSGKYRCYSGKGEWGYEKKDAWADKNNNITKWKLLSVSDEFKSVTKDSSNTFSVLRMYKYDSYDHVIEEIHIEDGDTTVYTNSYSGYDDRGNWTESKTQVDGRFKILTKRTIKYTE